MQHLGKVPVAIDTSVQEAHARKIILVTKSHRDKCKERRRGRGNYPELKWSLGRGARWGRGGVSLSLVGVPPGGTACVKPQGFSYCWGRISSACL